MIPVVLQSFDVNDTTTIINQSYITSNSGGTPEPIFLLIGGVSLLILVLAFYLPLRNEVGDINVAKVGMSFTGAILNSLTALCSFSILENNGIGVSVAVNNYTVIASQYTIWSNPIINVIFIVSAALCIIMFLYSIMQPAITTKPDRDDYKNKNLGDKE